MDVDDPVNVFAYLDYRALLRDLFAARKQREYGFSHRAFSRRAGLRSSNYLKLVMDGHRNLSAEMAQRFALGFGLPNAESEYFCELVAFNQAKTAHLRNQSHARLSRFARFREVHTLDAAQAAYHSQWYIPAIRELVARDDFSEDPQWIARVLQPSISVPQAREALRILLELSLLERDEGGRLQQRDALLTTGAGPLGHHIVNYHRTMLESAARALDQVPRDEREVSALTLCVSDQVMRELKRRIDEFRRELLAFAEQDGVPERVVQINFQLFPLSRKKEENDVEA